jgi:uncharacterized protein (TIGR00288 family)
MGRLSGLLGADERGEPRVALFVDGPNVLREEFDVEFSELRAVAGRAGRLATTRLYLDEHATPGLVQAAEAGGFEVVVTSGDVDVRLAIDATDRALSGDVEVIAVASRDTDFKPVLELAGREGLRTLAIAPGEHGRSAALANAADEAVVLEE